MLIELKRCNSIGDLKGIIFFVSMLAANRKLNRSEIASRSSLENGIRINCPGMIAFFQYLGLVNVSETKVECTDACPEWSTMSESGIIDYLVNQCIHTLLEDGVFDDAPFAFDSVLERLCFKPSIFPLQYAAIRNFLFSAEVFQSAPGGEISVTPSYESVFVQPIRSRRSKLTLEQLKRQQEEQSKRGLEAEEFVLKYEQKRLPSLATRIKRISDFDVGAGYDIASFSDENAGVYNRFIEVKTYIGSPHFYWSDNEADVAKLKKDAYILCLVDYSKMSDPSYVPDFIPNPYDEVFTTNNWLVSTSSYRIDKISST